MEERSENFSGLPTALAAVGGLFVFEIAAFNSGYYAAMGTEYLNFFSFTDFTTTALFLMPVTLITVFLTGVAYFIFLLFKSIAHLSGRASGLISFIAFIISAFAIVSYTEQPSMRVVAYIGGILYFVSAAIFLKGVMSPQKNYYKCMVLSFLGASFVIVLFGFYMANMDLRYRRPSLVETKFNYDWRVRVFRSSGAGVLAEDCETGQIVFIPWSSIVSIKRSRGCIDRYDSSIPPTLRYLFI